MSRHARSALFFSGFCLIYLVYLFSARAQFNVDPSNPFYVFPLFWFDHDSTDFNFWVNLWTCITLMVWIWFGVAFIGEAGRKEHHQGD
ncbi:MAG: hypothetical protein OWQ59_11550 [Alicyclobacillaceae bacterium]|uniref:hypothetical protein n=1 Tax=Alicyclobacillus sp. SP_1 TaxID=2942475 RepID=UPI0021581CB1|nr:hypothetical protein [Alicyclobacillus sp. SP_1]MCY0889075.1 hypothetical protein [Alicyclobacillaceae bacterium]